MKIHGNIVINLNITLRVLVVLSSYKILFCALQIHMCLCDISSVSISDCQKHWYSKEGKKNIIIFSLGLVDSSSSSSSSSYLYECEMWCRSRSLNYKKLCELSHTHMSCVCDIKFHKQKNQPVSKWISSDEIEKKKMREMKIYFFISSAMMAEL